MLFIKQKHYFIVSLTLFIGVASLGVSQLYAAKHSTVAAHQSVDKQVEINRSSTERNNRKEFTVSRSSTVGRPTEGDYVPANVSIVGSYNILKVKMALSLYGLQDSELDSSNTSKLIYLPKGQHLNIHINGDNNKVLIEESVLEQITLNDQGSDNELVEI